MSNSSQLCQIDSNHKHPVDLPCQTYFLTHSDLHPTCEILRTMATDEGLYQILEIPEPSARGRHLLGSVVPLEYYTAPLTRYAPYYDSPRWETEEGKKKKQSLDKNLDTLWNVSNGKGSETVPLHNLLSAQGTSNSNDASGKVTEVLKAFFNKSRHKNFKIENGETVQYNIDNPGRALDERLCACLPWLDEVRELDEKNLRKDKDRKYLIVTGVWACKNTTISWDEDSDSKKGLESRLPVGETASAATGAPIPTNVTKIVDPELKYDGSRGQHTRAHATLADGTIFAVRYHVLELQLEPTESTKEEKASSGVISGLMSKIRSKRRNSGLTEVPRPRIKSVSLDQPLRGGNNALGSYGGGSVELLYWVEPDHVSPEDLMAESNTADVDDAPNGVAN